MKTKEEWMKEYVIVMIVSFLAFLIIVVGISFYKSANERFDYKNIDIGKPVPEEIKGDLLSAKGNRREYGVSFNFGRTRRVIAVNDTIVEIGF